jgi:proteic killer suppression protein
VGIFLASFAYFAPWRELLTDERLREGLPDGQQIEIESFASRETELVFRGLISRKLPHDVQRTARRKLLYLNDAQDLRDLLAPPGNRLEKLSGDRAGQYSIRINDQWRICFRWQNGQALDVEIVDYHS